MESTSVRGKIQVSEETAGLLKQSGKEFWLQAREEKVHAKGKGELKVSIARERTVVVVVDNAMT